MFEKLSLVLVIRVVSKYVFDDSDKGVPLDAKSFQFATVLSVVHDGKEHGFVLLVEVRFDGVHLGGKVLLGFCEQRLLYPIIMP